MQTRLKNRLMRFPIILIGILFSSVLYAGELAVLVDGEVWIGRYKLTSTGGNISELVVSPSKLYAAASRIIGYYHDPDDDPDDDEPGEKIPDYLILIIDLSNQVILKELRAPDQYTRPGEWRSDDSYVFYQNEGSTITTRLKYNPKTDQVEEFPYGN